MLKTPEKYFNFWDWDILINDATGYNLLDDKEIQDKIDRHDESIK